MPEPEMTALAGEPVPVEFCHGGTWYAAVLLGWRHAEDGSCDLRVQFVVGGLRRTTWLPLTDVRLAVPEEPAPRRGAGPRTRPGLLVPDGSLPLRAVPPPRRPGDDRSRVQA